MTSADLTAKPRLRPGVDLTRLGLSVEEGILASLIDGVTTVRDLCHLVTCPLDETQARLERLTRVGVVMWSDPTQDLGKPEAEPTGAKPDYGNFVFPPSLMGEPGELKPEDRKRIIWFHVHLDRWTHYELLQASRKADKQELKRAYFARSKEWHPDRFKFANELGSFRMMLEQIFERVRTAHSVLSDPKQRKAYDEENVLMMADEDIAVMLNEQRREERERRRAVEREERRRRNNPMKQRIRRAKGLMEDAVREREQGDILKALGLAQMAEAYDAREEHQQVVAELKKEAAEARIAPLLRRGAHYESLTNWPEAVDLFQEAVRIAPDNGPARVRLAFNLVMARRDLHDATSHAQKGIQLVPDDPEAHFVLGLCYDSAGKAKSATRSLEKAVELKPNYKEAKKRLRELRWGF